MAMSKGVVASLKFVPTYILRISLRGAHFSESYQGFKHLPVCQNMVFHSIHFQFFYCTKSISPTPIFIGSLYLNYHFWFLHFFIFNLVYSI